MGKLPLTGQHWPWEKAFLLSLLVVAFGLRLYGSWAQSFWMDELASLNYVGIPFAEIIPVSIATYDPQPPLFYFLLNPWSALAGHSELALRFLSLFVGVVAIPALYQLGHRLGSSRAGLVAASIMTLSPFHLWYAQDLRPYTLATALALVSTLFFLRLLKPGVGWRPWLGYTVVTALALYSHFFLLLLPLLQSLVYLALLRHRNLRAWGWLLAQGAVALALLPWLWQTSRLMRFYDAPPLSYSDMLGRIALQLSVGWFLDWDQSVVIVIPMLLLAGLGAVVHLQVVKTATAPSVSPRERLLLLAAWIVVPILGAFAYYQATGRFLFAERYFIWITPAYYLLIAFGLLSLGRLSPLLPAIALVALGGAYLAAISNYYNSPAKANPDYRAAAAYIERLEQDGDGIVTLHEWVSIPFEHYYQGTAPIHAISTWAEPEEVERLLAEVAARHRRLWFLPPSADVGPAQLWLTENAYLVEERWFPQALVALYLTPTDGLGAVKPVEANLGGLLLLEGYRLESEPMVVGDGARLELHWRALEGRLPRLKVSLRLADSRGHVVFQTDREPRSGIRPTNAWEQGELIRDRYGIAVPLGSLPGHYQITVGVYQAADGHPISILNAESVSMGEWLALDKLEVFHSSSPPDPATLGVIQPLEAKLGRGLSILGLDPLPTSLHPGQTLTLSLFLQAAGPIDEEVKLVTEVAGDAGEMAGHKVGSMMNEVFPSWRWRPGELIHDFIDVPLSARAKGGRYRVSLSLEGEPPVELGSIVITSPGRSFAMPEITHQQPVPFLDGIDFLGYDLTTEEGGIIEDGQSRVKAGEGLHLTLYWRAREEPQGNYTVFTHLLGPDGRLWGQRDGTPQSGASPTGGWLKGQVVSDEHQFTVDPQTPPGDYRIEVGLYRSEGGRRLTTEQGEDRILLSKVRVR